MTVMSKENTYCISVVGPPGTGKSTFINAVAPNGLAGNMPVPEEQEGIPAIAIPYLVDGETNFIAFIEVDASSDCPWGRLSSRTPPAFLRISDATIFMCSCAESRSKDAAKPFVGFVREFNPSIPVALVGTKCLLTESSPSLPRISRVQDFLCDANSEDPSHSPANAVLHLIRKVKKSEGENIIAPVPTTVGIVACVPKQGDHAKILKPFVLRAGERKVISRNEIYTKGRCTQDQIRLLSTISSKHCEIVLENGKVSVMRRVKGTDITLDNGPNDKTEVLRNVNDTGILHPDGSTLILNSAEPELAYEVKSFSTFTKEVKETTHDPRVELLLDIMPKAHKHETDVLKADLHRKNNLLAAHKEEEEESYELNLGDGFNGLTLDEDIMTQPQY